MDISATLSLISHHFISTTLKPCSLKARGIGGEQRQVLGMKEFEVNVGTLTKTHSFGVVGIRNTCILAADFLKFGKVVVDVGNSKLSWPEEEVPLIIETTTSTVNNLSVLLESYSDVFVHGPNDPSGRTTRAEHCVDTGDSRLMKQRSYQIHVHLHNVVTKQVNDMLERSLIRPSNSPWS